MYTEISVAGLSAVGISAVFTMAVISVLMFCLKHRKEKSSASNTSVNNAENGQLPHDFTEQDTKNEQVSQVNEEIEKQQLKTTENQVTSVETQNVTLHDEGLTKDSQPTNSENNGIINDAFNNSNASMNDKQEITSNGNDENNKGSKYVKPRRKYESVVIDDATSASTNVKIINNSGDKHNDGNKTVDDKEQVITEPTFETTDALDPYNQISDISQDATATVDRTEEQLSCQNTKMELSSSPMKGGAECPSDGKLPMTEYDHAKAASNDCKLSNGNNEKDDKVDNTENMPQDHSMPEYSKPIKSPKSVKRISTKDQSLKDDEEEIYPDPPELPERHFGEETNNGNPDAVTQIQLENHSSVRNSDDLDDDDYEDIGDDEGDYDDVSDVENGDKRISITQAQNDTSLQTVDTNKSNKNKEVPVKNIELNTAHQINSTQNVPRASKNKTDSYISDVYEEMEVSLTDEIDISSHSNDKPDDKSVDYKDGISLDHKASASKCETNEDHSRVHTDANEQKHRKSDAYEELEVDEIVNSINSLNSETMKDAKELTVTSDPLSNDTVDEGKAINKHNSDEFDDDQDPYESYASTLAAMDSQVNDENDNKEKPKERANEDSDREEQIYHF